jgi:hypothetical protein
MLPNGQIVDQATAVSYALSTYGGTMITLNGASAQAYYNWLQSPVSPVDVGVKVVPATPQLVTNKNGTLGFAFGVTMQAQVDVTGLNYTSFNWVQTVSSDQTATFGMTTVTGEHVDGIRDETGQLTNSPLYYTSGEAADNANSTTAYFSDNPSTITSSINWNANATLVGVTSSGQLVPIVTISWGYRVTPNTSASIANPALSIATPLPYTISTSTPAYVQSQINQYNNSR